MLRRIRVGAVVVLATLLPAGASSAQEAHARLSNRSRVACVLNGYPVVSFSDRRGTIPS